jgi:hypothetical protein
LGMTLDMLFSSFLYDRCQLATLFEILETFEGL